MHIDLIKNIFIAITTVVFLNDVYAAEDKGYKGDVEACLNSIKSIGLDTDLPGMDNYIKLDNLASNDYNKIVSEAKDDGIEYINYLTNEKTGVINMVNPATWCQNFRKVDYLDTLKGRAMEYYLYLNNWANSAEMKNVYRFCKSQLDPLIDGPNEEAELKKCIENLEKAGFKKTNSGLLNFIVGYKFQDEQLNQLKDDALKYYHHLFSEKNISLLRGTQSWCGLNSVKAEL